MNQGLDDANTIGYVESIVVLRQVHIGFLLSIGPDEGVDLCALNIVKCLHSLLDFKLARFYVDNENKGVDLLDLLHGRLGGQWVLDNRILVQFGEVLNRLAWVLGLTFGLVRLGAPM